jgi:HEPN domain-containing protein
MPAYHLQQVEEKRVKALLVHLGIAPLRSHDLGFLLARIVGDEVAPEVFEAANEVSAYAWLTGYPGTPEISQEQINAVQQRVSHIKAFVKARLNS